MAFLENKRTSKKDYAKDIEVNIINLLEHQDNPDLLNLTKAHKDIIYNMGNIKPNEFNRKEILELVGWGILIPERGDEVMGVRFRGGYALTPYGYAVAHHLKTQARRRFKRHDLLALQFARSKELMKMISFLDIELKSKNYGLCRPDVFIMKPTYNQEMVKPTAYEIKVSRSDFLSDIAKPDKRRAYLEVAEALYYVCPEGLIDKKEVPQECGLIYFEEKYNNFAIKKHAKRGKVELSQDNMMRLILHTKKTTETILINKSSSKPIKIKKRKNRE